jgi:hypothetical protein
VSEGKGSGYVAVGGGGRWRVEILNIKYVSFIFPTICV